MAKKEVAIKPVQKRKKTFVLRPSGKLRDTASSENLPDFDRINDYQKESRQQVRLMLLLRQKLVSLETKLCDLQADITGRQIVEQRLRV